MKNSYLDFNTKAFKQNRQIIPTSRNEEMDKTLSYKSKIMNKTRTAGDGMESVEPVAENSRNPNIKIARKDSLPTSRLIQMYPSAVFRANKTIPQLHAKSPKFVPYEPYSCAVKPIIPKKKCLTTKKSKNNMDINTLISQMSQMDTALPKFKPRAKLCSTDKLVAEVDNLFPEKDEMQKKIDDLSKENETLKAQLQQQVQVNKELKTMLVASMGEDLETQVQTLNEDKKYLANALNSSAQHLSTHQEQTEWLAGQCEVWRSKFLASSLMVEELAHWKKTLSEKTASLEQAIWVLLDEKCRVRDMMLCTYKNLYTLHERWLENLAISEYVGNSKLYNKPIGNLNLNVGIPSSTNIIDMALVNLKLSENISSSEQKHDVSHLDNLPSLTEGDRNAECVISTPLEVKRVNEEPVNALVSHAYSNSTTTAKPMASCIHCNGKVQLL